MSNTAEVIKFPDKKQEPGNRNVQKEHGGFLLIYRSMRQKAWYKDLFKKAVMLELLSCAAYKDGTTYFNGLTHEIKAGEFITSAASIAEDSGILDELGVKKTANSRVNSILNFFVKEGVLTKETVGSGNFRSTKISIINWSKFQQLEQSPKQAPTQSPLNNIKTYKDLKDPLSENSSQTTSDNKKVIREGAAIQTPNGSKWGMEIDLLIAKEIFSGVNNASGGNEKQPSFADWANTIRLMRERDNRDPKHISVLATPTTMMKSLRS